MYKIISIALSIIILLSNLLFMSFAHSGRTDASGGHRDNKNKSGLGSYHYHCGGYPAHLHTNGICQYKTSSNTNKAVSASKSSSASIKSNTISTSNNSSDSSSSKQIVKIIVTSDETYVYEEASKSSYKLGTAKKGHSFTHIGSTKSFWKIQYKKKNEHKLHTGYILKSDSKEKTE